MEMHSADEFSTAFEYASSKTAERFQNPLWRLTELITGWRLRKSIATVKSFGNDIVTRAQQSRDHSKVNEEEETQTEITDLTNENDSRLSRISGSLINALLDSIATPQFVADAALNYLSAGRDTTAQSLTWAFYSLSRHPETIASIRREIQALITPEQTLDPRLLTPDRCPYILAVFYETLRLYPPVPFEIKQVLQPTVLPDGTQLSSSFVLVWCTWAMNRSFTTWGTDAADFRPKRWLDDNGKIVSKSAFEFPVFNGGVRMCLGKRMAEMMAVMVIGRLVWSFDFERVEEGEKRTGSSLTLPMEGGLEVFVRPVER
jgi:cytochrome P450